jgi:SAM-dependent methyltransferase
MWGSSPSEYVSFARKAFTSADEGIFLDAGCGSLLFTAPIYLNSNRRIIAFDQSLTMLRRARQRLVKLAGTLPEHILLLQSDLSDLPFRSNSFRTILCLNVLHQFADAATLISNLKKLLTSDGSLYLSSLILNNRFVGDLYLQALYASGEFVRPRSLLEIKKIFEKDFRMEVSCHAKGNMAYLST